MSKQLYTEVYHAIQLATLEDMRLKTAYKKANRFFDTNFLKTMGDSDIEKNMSLDHPFELQDLLLNECEHQLLALEISINAALNSLLQMHKKLRKHLISNFKEKSIDRDNPPTDSGQYFDLYQADDYLCDYIIYFEKRLRTFQQWKHELNKPARPLSQASYQRLYTSAFQSLDKEQQQHTVPTISADFMSQSLPKLSDQLEPHISLKNGLKFTPHYEKPVEFLSDIEITLPNDFFVNEDLHQKFSI